MRIITLLIFLVCLLNKPCLADQKDNKFDAASLYKDAQAAAAKPQEEALSMQQGRSDGIKAIHKILQNEEGNAKGKATELGSLPQEGERIRENTDSTALSCNKEDCNVASVLGTKAVNRRDAKLESLGFTKDKESFPENSKGYLDQINRRAKEVAKNYDQITGTYKDCKPIEREFAFKETKECDEYYDVKYNNCPISQVVEIDPKYTYQCNKKRLDFIKTCHDEISSITCKKSEECDNGGIILSTVKTNLQNQSYHYPTLYVGTPYWEPWICSIDSSKYTTFEVKNLEKVKSFVLEQVRFDDYVMIKLNDHLVYHGPDSEAGEDRIELIRPGRYGVITTNGHNRKPCERSTHWHRTIQKDLKQYLKEGENTISVTIATAGHGMVEMKIRAKQHCCKDWDITWDKKCNYEGGNDESM